MARATATLRLLRAIAALGPRLHEPGAADSPEALYALVCDALRSCGLYAHIARLDATGVLRIVATSLDPEMVAAIEALIGTSFRGYPIVSPIYDAALQSDEAVLIADVASILEPIVPHITHEQRVELARGAGAERAIVAPLVASGQIGGLLSVWGTRDRLGEDDIPAVAALAAQAGIALENARLLRQAEEEHARWRAAADSMEDMVVTSDPKGRLTYFNAAAERILGEFNLPLPADGDLESRGLFRADGSPYARGELPLDVALSTGQPARDLVIVFRAEDGVERHTLWSASPIRMPDETLIGAVATGRDVTRPRLLEEMNRAALRVLLRVAAIVTEPADASTLLARLAEALSHLAAVHQAHAMLADGERPVPLAIFGAAPDVEESWKEAVRAFSPPPGALGPLLERFRAGQILKQDLVRERPIISDVAVTGAHVRAALTAPVLVGGEIAGLLTISRSRAPAPDMAAPFAPWDEDLLLGVARLAGEALERQRLADQLVAAEAARQAAEEATRQRDEFLGVASHELRTPLTSIRMNLQLTRRRLAEVSDERLRDLLDRTERQVLRLNRFVEDLVDAQRIAADKLELRTGDFDLRALVAEAVEEQRQVAWPGRIRLDLPERALPARGDAVRIGQVVANYLTNALKYSPEERPVVVSLAAEDGQARLTVRDEGPGLSPQEQVRVWERFHQAAGVRVLTGSGVGLGLGLYISRTIIERHGGQVGVESTLGEGATFWFTLPLASSPDADSAAADAGDAAAAPSPGRE